MSPRIVRRAKIKQGMNLAGSLSSGSSEIQATGRSVLATHSLSIVVFPEPAEAEISVTGYAVLSFYFSIRCERDNRSARSGGINSFEVKIGEATE